MEKRARRDAGMVCQTIVAHYRLAGAAKATGRPRRKEKGGTGHRRPTL